MSRAIMCKNIGPAVLLALLVSGVANGQTIIIDHHPHPHPPIVHPPPRPPRSPRPPRPPQRNMPLTVRKHAVEVSIVDGVSVTDIDQVFFNPHDRSVEGTYIFPLADDIALSKFTMFVNGQEVEGKLLSVEDARREYESIVARMRDPALLEYLGTRMFRARIFPINPKSEVRVRLSYTQMLAADNGLVRYRYPLGTEKHLAAPIDDLSLFVRIESSTPIKSVFSPTHKMAISRQSDYKASASYEGRNVYPDKNFDLYCALSQKEFGLTILTHREAGEDGFFLARIAPPARAEGESVLPKDIAFVIDTSGSMDGEKMEQARRALKFCLSNLNSGDRFSIVPFSHEALRFRDGLTAATGDNVAKARRFVDGLRANGGTNIEEALLAALSDAPDADRGRPYLIVFLTDGQPTVGVTAPEEILRNVASKNTGRVRLFVFGLGHDVNADLLDLLAEQNRGARDYVEPGEDLELKLSSFHRKVSDPVLADLALSFGGLEVYDIYPPVLSDLFSGGELVVAGRYRGDGARAVELTGVRRGTKERFVYETTFPREKRTHEFLPRLWATRKIGFLLDEIRLHGENKELKDTIVRLATTHGIVTPYTAYLVTEPGGVAFHRGTSDNLLAQAIHGSGKGESRLAPLLQEAGEAMAPAPGGGGKRVPKKARRARIRASRGVNAARLADASDLDRYDSVLDAEEASEAKGRHGAVVKRVGTRTFYRIENRWVDASYDRNTTTRKVEPFSTEYFELLRKHPRLAKCFALGERVVVVIDGVAYESAPVD